MPDSDTLNAIATSPIPGANPTGESARYDEMFATLEAEVGKLDNPAGGDVDWRVVEEGAVTLLTTKSKDILVAAWLARAMLEREGCSGLAAGLRMIRGLTDAFWEQLHPQRTRPRRAALEWLSDKLAASMPEDRLADTDGVATCIAEIEAIAAASSGRFDGEDCGLMALLTRLRAVDQPVAAAEGTANDAAAGGNGGSPQGGPVRGGASGPIANRTQAIARLRELADWWAKHEPTSPMVPLLGRAVTWSELDFQSLFAQLLRTKTDAREHMWDVLGIQDPSHG